MVASTAALFAILASLTAGHNVLPNAMGRDQAIVACSANGQQLASLTGATIDSISALLPGGKAGWIASWNGDSYGCACLQLSQGTVTVAGSCQAQLLPICQDIPTPQFPQPPCPPRHFERYDLKVLVANAENRRLKAEPEAPIESIHLDIEALQASVGPLNNAPDSALPVDARINTEQIHIPAPAPSTSAVSSNLVCPTPPSQVHAAPPSSSSISPSKSRVISKMPAVPVPELEIVDVNDLPPNFNPFRFVQIFASENGILTRGRGLPLPDIANFRSSPPVNDACGICLGSLKRHALDEAGMEIKGGLVRMPRCIHVYHLSCAVKWFSSNNTCPHCRTPADY